MKVKLDLHGFKAEREIPFDDPPVTIEGAVMVRMADESDADADSLPSNEELLTTYSLTFRRRGQVYVCAGCRYCTPRSFAAFEVRNIAARAATEAITLYLVEQKRARAQARLRARLKKKAKR